jgi:hypothetical protein
MGRLAAMAQLARSNPSELRDRIRMAVEAGWAKRIDTPGSYAPIPASDVPKALTPLGLDIERYADDRALHEIERHVRHAAAGEEHIYGRRHNMDTSLARVAYLLIRVTRPEVVIETGVAFGISTAFVLQALRENGSGGLHSVDLPPIVDLDGDLTGRAVPTYLRDRWVLHRGSSVRVLPRVLSEVGVVDFFIHDSLHTRRHMAWELDKVTPFLQRGSAVIVDDAGKNRAFEDWVGAAPTRVSITVWQPTKQGIAGLAVL